MSERQQEFMRWFEPLQPRLERFVLAMACDVETARDVIAETSMIAYERFDSLRNREAFLSFLFTIALRVYRSEVKRGRRVDRLADGHVADLLDPGIPPDVAADVVALYEGLARLPERQREAVLLFEIIGLPMKEIREIQGGTVTAVKVRISRGRKRLAEILGITSEQISQISPDVSPPSLDRDEREWGRTRRMNDQIDRQIDSGTELGISRTGS